MPFTFSFFVAALVFAPILPAVDTLALKKFSAKYPELFASPVAHAGTTKTKTIEFFVGQDQTSGTGVAAGANWSPVFTVDLPDAITSPTMIKSAWIDYTFQSASTAAPGIVTLGLTPSGFSETTFTSASYATSGENYTIRIKPDFTAAMQAAMQTAGTKSITFRANVAGTSRKMENAKMFVTYDYDDTATTQINTVKYRIGQNTGNVAVGATGVTFTSPTMAIGENSPTVVSAWSEIRGQVPATGTTDNTFAVNYDTDAVSNYYLDNAGSTDSQAIYILHPKNSITLNTTHNLKIAATAGYQMNLVSAEQVITYKFNYTASTLLTQTSEIMLGSDGNKASSVSLDVLDTVTLPEDSIALKNIYMRGTGHSASSGSYGLAVRKGATTPTPATSYAQTVSNETLNNFWILSDDVNDLGTMVQGDNVISATFAGTMTSRAMHLIVTYTFAKTSLTQSGAATFWVEQQSAYGTTGTPTVNVNIAGTPVSGSYRSFTWANSVNGITSDKAVSISVNPTSPRSYNWNSTGEYQWLLFFDKNANDEIVGNGSYTVNLGSTGTNVMAAVEQISWRYTAVSVNVTSYVNTTETALNYSASCVGCGARIGGGAGFRQSITIMGTGFGTVAAGNRSSAANNIKIGTHQIADANITIWTPSSITFLTDSAVSGDTDTDWGTEFGGASALTVTAGSVTSSGKNFYVFPQITSVTQPAGFGADTAREYDAGDTDGVITLNGTRFGSSQGTGSVAIVGQTSTAPSWTNTAIQVQVSPSIADTTNTGSISMTQGAGANGKTHTYANTIRILPRITGFTPSSAAELAPVTINGNHFCQAASCPVVFSASNKVTFTSGVLATVFTSWSATAITTDVPAGSVTGDVLVTSNTYDSNGKNFTVVSNVPNAPTSLSQWSNAALSASIAVGASASSTPIYLTMTVENTGISGGSMYPQAEYKPIGTAFSCVAASACASAVEGLSAGSAPGPVDCAVVGNNCAIAITPSDDVYHWQARVRFNKSGIDYYGPWVSFDSANPETSTDFKIDTTAPAITLVSSGTPGGNDATITWSTAGEISTSRVEYNTTGVFTGGYDCAGTSECTTLADVSPMVNSHSVLLSNLGSGTLYYYRVRSKDVAGNETISTSYSFTTQSITQPAKTTKAYIDGAVGSVSSPATYYFTVNIPETVPTVQNAYIEVFGIVSGGSGTITVGANGVASRAYAVSAPSPTLYRLFYQITAPNSEANLNLNDADPCSNAVVPGTPPLCNSLTITPDVVSMYVLSAKVITTYSYTP